MDWPPQHRRHRSGRRGRPLPRSLCAVRPTVPPAVVSVTDICDGFPNRVSQRGWTCSRRQQPRRGHRVTLDLSRISRGVVGRGARRRAWCCCWACLPPASVLHAQCNARCRNPPTRRCRTHTTVATVRASHASEAPVSRPWRPRGADSEGERDASDGDGLRLVCLCGNGQPPQGRVHRRLAGRRGKHRSARRKDGAAMVRVHEH